MTERNYDIYNARCPECGSPVHRTLDTSPAVLFCAEGHRWQLSAPMANILADDVGNGQDIDH